MLTDSHFHDWDNPWFDAINAGCSATDLEQRIKRYGENSFIHFGAAMGPWEVRNRTQEEIDEQFVFLLQNIRKYDPLFIGEIGLDYHFDYDRDLQKALFIRQLDLASMLSKKVLIHCRDAASDVCEILEDHAPAVGGVIHCCDGSPSLIAKALEKNFYISFAGNVTYKANENLRNALRCVPPERLLLETDAPYLAPVPFRGRTNSPDLIEFTYRAVSEYLGISMDELTALVYSNFRAFIGHGAD